MYQSLPIGPVFIRTVTHNHLARLDGVEDGFLWVSEVSWIAETGARLGAFLASGPTLASEIEPMPTCRAIGLGAVIDICVWSHRLPTEAV